MKVVITQPNYMPWLGYFAQLNSCDLWVVLDDVQYSRREWQNRNRILDFSSTPQYLTLPIQKSPRSSLINQILLSSGFRPQVHIEKIKLYYLDSPYFNDVFPFIEYVLQTAYDRSEGLLSRLNVIIISLVCDYLGIAFGIEYSSYVSGFVEAGTATEKLSRIAKFFNATTYLSSAGAKDYMSPELNLFSEASINVLWQEFNYSAHHQYRNKNEFVSHLSFVDYLFNCGFDNFIAYISMCHNEVL